MVRRTLSGPVKSLFLVHSRRKSMLARSIFAFIMAERSLFCSLTQSVGEEASCPSMLDHKISNLLGEPVSLCQLTGKVVLIVNTVSEGGYTPQYEGLEKL